MKPPPYANELESARAKGEYINPWLFAGPDAWELASYKGPGRLVLPPESDPADFDWSIVRGLTVVLRWPEGSEDEIRALSRRLLRSGARSVIDLGNGSRDATRYARKAP